MMTDSSSRPPFDFDDEDDVNLEPSQARLSRLESASRLRDGLREVQANSPQSGADSETRARPSRDANRDDLPSMGGMLRDRAASVYRDEDEKPKRRAMPRSYTSARVSDDERTWAAAAHISAWITFLGGIFTIGTVIPFSIFIPLAIYFYFRKKSDFVAFHALQAFTLQLLGTVGALVILLAGGLVWGMGMVIAILAVAVLVGIILVPIWGLVGIVLLLVTIVLPLAMLLYGTIAAIETYNGRDYQYPFIARWVDRQLAGGFLNAA